jgi:hypothetical protein
MYVCSSSATQVGGVEEIYILESIEVSPDKIGTDIGGYSDKRAVNKERASLEDDLRR